MKSARAQLDILSAYRVLGSYRAAAELCGTTHKTVRRVVERQGRWRPEPPPRPKSTDPYRDLIAERVKATDGRMSAKRLLPLVRAEGYGGSPRHLRRAVAEAKAAWKASRRVYRPWQPVPGEHLVIDWGSEGDLHVFCAVLAWSRVRFVRFAADETQATTLALLAECFETLGGVPAVVLADRMGCLKGGVVANVVVPAPGYVTFAAHYGFRPDFCEAADPESKGVVEHLVGYAKADLVVPALGWTDLAAANRDALAWCAEVNAAVHSEIAAIPAERLGVEQALLARLPSLRPAPAPTATRTFDRLRTVRYGSARYSVPGRYIGRKVNLVVAGGALVISADGSDVARHRLVGPGEMSLDDAHYPGRAQPPARAIRPRTPAEIAFLGLGSAAGPFLRAAAASGMPRLAGEIADIVALEPAYGRDALAGALERALTYRRFRAADLRAILAAGAGVPRHREPGQHLVISVPVVPVRPLAAYAAEPAS
ncbi:MAG: IS21 family transposase [Candidatus Limnocylindrales bacterium]